MEGVREVFVFYQVHSFSDILLDIKAALFLNALVAFLEALRCSILHFLLPSFLSHFDPFVSYIFCEDLDIFLTSLAIAQFICSNHRLIRFDRSPEPFPVIVLVNLHL